MDNIYEVILFGSVARGVATEESDVDIALIVDDEDDGRFDSLLDYIVSLNLEYDILISAITLNKDKYTE